MRTALGLSLFLSFNLFANPILVLSGGGSPTGNHYSQYLQTKTLTDSLRNRLGYDLVDVLFAAGNNYKDAPLIADVHKQDGDLHTMIVGKIEDNQEATKPNVKDYFSNIVPRRTRGQDTFFLFVSDHGMPNVDKDDNTDKTYSNNCIDLWAYDGDSMQSKEWSERCLSQKELKSLIKKNVKSDKTLYVMSQCFSGGFHQMTVQSNEAGYPTADHSICGFTAATKDETASGCTAEVSADTYKGYERHFTEMLTGTNVIDGELLSSGPSLTAKEAHYKAALIDYTKDIPLASSDYYLMEWSKQIEESNFKPRSGLLKAQTIKNAYSNIKEKPHSLLLQAIQIYNSIIPTKTRKELSRRIQYLEAMEQSLASEFPELEGIEDKQSSDIEKMYWEYDEKMTELDNKWDSLMSEYQVLRYEAYFTPWWENFETDSKLSDYQRKMEKNVFGYIESMFQGTQIHLAKGLSQNLIKQLSVLTIIEPETATAMQDYFAKREETINKYIKETSINATEVNKLFALKKEMENLEDSSYYQKLKGLTRRILSMRKQIASLLAIHIMRDQAAINDYNSLVSCESATFE